ncbi:MAG: hypothetical protein P8178_09235 [Candidatus Thiodiazotropha sp.]
MSASANRPVPIGTIGMDQRQRNALRVLFSTQCANRYVLVEEASAEICLLDLDAFGGEAMWREFRQRQPEQPLILVSLQARTTSDGHTLFVRKPIPVAQLIEAIEQQCRRLTEPALAEVSDAACEFVPPAPDVAPSHAPRPSSPPAPRTPSAHRAAAMMSRSAEQTFVGTAPDIDPHDPQQRRKIYYNPDHYLQGHLQQALNLAVRHNRNVTIEGPWPALDLFVAERRLRVAAEDRHLRPYCTLPDTTLELRLQFFDGERGRVEAGRDYPLAASFWKLALWASRGRLPADTSLTQPIYLRRWPNFTRLTVTPYALAIAALWAEQPRSLLDTAQRLGIPQRYVFAFYSAARSLQLVGETRRAVDTLIAPPAIAASKHRGLFGRLLDRLRGETA